MSKVKKLISCLLAVLMVLSASPLSFAYLIDSDGTPYAEGSDYSYGTSSYVSNPTQITVDTSETTEVIRIADSTNNCLNGNTIVKANAAGIAETSGIFTNFAYGGPEFAPTQPTVKLKIIGITDKSKIDFDSITTSDINGWTSSSPTWGTGDNCVTATWNIPVGLTISGEKNVVFNITFRYAGNMYTAHAYSCSKYVVRPNGLMTHCYATSWGSVKIHAAIISELLCAQSVPGWYNNESASHTRSYIKYDANVTSGQALSGAGKDDAGDGSWVVKSNEYGGLVARSYEGSWSSSGEKSSGSFSFSLNGDRPTTTIYIDKGYDHLGTGTSGTLTNGLGMRWIYKPGDTSKFTSAALQSFKLYAEDHVAGSSDDIGDAVSLTGTLRVGNATTGTMYADDALYKCTHQESGWTTSTLTAGTHNNLGTGRYVTKNDVSTEGCFVRVLFTGTGAKTSGTTWSFGYTVQNNLSNDIASVESGARHKFTGWISVKFMTYDTTTLRAILNAIDNGTTYTYNGTTYGNKGAFPQYWMYGGESFQSDSRWTSFVSAYNAARSLIAKFDVTDAQITSAINALATAYNNLPTYVANGTITVRHLLKDSSTELVPAQTFRVEGTWGQQSNTGLPAIANGASFSIQALVDSSNNCTLKGYKVSGPSVITGSVSFSSTGTSLKDDSGNALGNELNFYYEPAAMQLKVGVGIYAGDQQYVYTTSVNSGADLDNTSSSPNFATIKQTILNQYTQPAHTVYAGIYDNAALSGTPIDGINIAGGAGTWSMPPQDTNVYVKWAAKPVKLKIITSYGATVTTSASPITPSMAEKTYEMGTVTFAEPTNPPSSAGMNFVNYYTDDTYTTTVSWPLTADYYGNEAYGIDESTDDSNYVTVYAKYVDLNNKIVFDTQGGTIADGTAVGEFTVNNNELSFAGTSFPALIGYPVPVREGYTFTGWVTDLNTNTPVAGWTTTDSSTETGVRAVENGVHTQPGTAGFICYATWQAKPITVTFQHNIPSTETNTLNSKNQEGQDFYYQIYPQACSPIDTSLFPSTPRRYGFKFNYWSYNGKRLDTTGNYAATDMVLTASWKASNNTVFAELITYVNVAGENEIADIQHNSANSTTPIAQKGDVVKIRMEVGGGFYAGSSSWIFAYDADFFEKVTGVTASANTDNEYISGIHADVYEINGTAAANAYDGMMNKTNGNVIDPYTGAAITNPGYIQVTIDPDISQMTNGYKTVTFSDSTTYMLEITLKIKSTTTKEAASFWLPEELVRTADNIMGDTYVAYTAGEASLNSVQTDFVDFDAMPVSTVKVQPDPRPTTTITVQLPATNSGAWSDGSTGLSKTYTGPAEAEILSTYTTDNVNYRESVAGDNTSNIKIGFPEPTRTGYHINAWNKVAGTGSATTWDSYSYANENQNGNTYELEWAPDEFTLSFYEDEECTSILGTVGVVYDQETVTPYSYESNNFTEFVGWIRQGEAKTTENIVDFSDYTVTQDETFYAWTKNARRNVTLQAVTKTTADDGTVTTTVLGQVVLTPEVQDALGIELRYDSSMRLVETIPASQAADTSYIDAATLDAMFDGKYTYEAADGTEKTLSSTLLQTAKDNYAVKKSALPVVYTVVLPINGNTVQVEMEGAIVTVTFKAGTAYIEGANRPVVYSGAYTPVIDETTGQYSWSITGRYGDTYNFDQVSAGIEVPFGYKQAFNGQYKGSFRTITYTASYTPATINIHFLKEDGTEIKTDSTAFRTPYAVSTKGPNAATMEGYKPGYKFSGWLVADPETHEAVNSTIVTSYNCSNSPTSNIKRTGTDNNSTYDLYFVPVYTVNSYNVIYNTVYTDTGAVSQYGTTESADFGSTYTVNGDASAVTGYSFDGWYSESAYADKTTKVTSFTVPADATTLYGFYVPETYKVYFYDNDGTDNKQEVDETYNAAIAAPTAPTRTGYEFKGWAASADSTTPVSLGTLTTAGNGQVKFYAIWEATAVDYYVDFYYEDLDGNYNIDSTLSIKHTGTVGEQVSVADGEKTNNVKTGYTYVAANNDETAKTIPAEGTLRLQVKYTLNTWTYKKDIDGTVTTIGTYKVGATLPTVEEPTKTGYRFDGWLNVPEDGKMPNRDVTITASWEINRYSITYYAETTDTEAFDTQTYAYGTATAATTKSISKTGYSFGGWYEAGSDTEYAFPVMPANDVTLYAKWNINTHTITFVTGEGGTVIAPITATYGTAIPAIADPVRTGYEFTSWSEPVPTTMPDREVTLTAGWELEQYTVKFDKNYEGCTNDIADKTAVYNGTVTMPEVEREGYTFAGWYTADNVRYESSTVFGDLGANGAVLQLYAHWTINGHTVTYKLAANEAWADGKTADVTTAYDFGDTIAAQAAPVKTGYKFDAWTYKNADTNAAYTGTTVPDFNLVATATWTVNQYTITFDTDGGNDIAAITGDYDTPVTAPANPTKAGYDFNGWDTEIPETIPAGDVTITATWTIHSYTVDFDMAGGTPQAQSQTATFNNTINTPVYGTDFTKAGYRFDGWVDEAGNEVGTTYTLPAMSNSGAHITLTATWTVNQYSITFNSQGGTAVADITQDYGTNVAAPEAPTKTGYDFGGWYENAECTGSRYSFSTMPAESVTLYAKWTDHNYTVVLLKPDNYSTYETEFATSLTYADHDAFETTYVTRGSAIGTLPTTQPDIAYYDFICWVDAEGNTVTEAWVMPAYDGDVYYIMPKYEEQEIKLVQDEGIAVVENDVPPVSGYIYNVGDQKTKTQIEDLFTSTGYSEIKVVPSKGKYCGTGTRVEIYSKKADITEPLEVYYIIVYGDVNGDAICKSNDLSICRSMVTATDKTWYVNNSVSNAAQLRACYELAADVNGDGIFNSYDTTLMELYTMGLKDYAFDSQIGSDTYYKYVTVAKA